MLDLSLAAANLAVGMRLHLSLDLARIPAPLPKRLCSRLGRPNNIINMTLSEFGSKAGEMLRPAIEQSWLYRN